MSGTSLYKEQLLAHFKNPRNRTDGSMDDKAVVKRGTNPRCGDDIQIGFNLTSRQVTDVQFKGRGCSVCMASSSMMTETVEGLAVENARELVTTIHEWLDGVDVELPDTLQPLAAVRDHPARKKCVLLCWNALNEGLEDNA